MFLRCQRRKKDGKAHEYWSIVESRRLADGRVRSVSMTLRHLSS